MNCETVGMMQNNKTVRSCVFLLVLSVLLRRARDASDAMSDADADLIVVMDKTNLKDVTNLPWIDVSRVRCLLEFHPESSRTEVPDPYYDGAEAFDLVLDLVDTATSALLDYLEERGLD